jgi:protein phosphatase PTC7
MGVADGVGGWAEVGVDPSVFAWALMGNAHEIALSGKESDVAIILRDAYRRIVDTKSVIAGSSTVCIASLDKQSGVLSCANLGDSGMRLLRNGVTVFQSDVQVRLVRAMLVRPITFPRYKQSVNPFGPICVLPGDKENGEKETAA